MRAPAPVGKLDVEHEPEREVTWRDGRAGLAKAACVCYAFCVVFYA